ncbi:hypothetical protein ICN47_06700 [Polynucleobacter sp. AP-Latsch-80-C2]|nr:hypothetical protein [Polynucleobacter sp. AP-Latsch-80-C2]
MQWLQSSLAFAQSVAFSCTRVERDFTETYELQVKAASGNLPNQKGKVFLDGRDLDRVGADGNQTIKNVLITKERISYLSDTRFEAEVFDGVSYPSGSVTSMVIIDRASGKLRKMDTVSGGILASSLGEGTKSYEEQCVPLKDGKPSID